MRGAAIRGGCELAAAAACRTSGGSDGLKGRTCRNGDAIELRERAVIGRRERHLGPARKKKRDDLDVLVGSCIVERRSARVISRISCSTTIKQ